MDWVHSLNDLVWIGICKEFSFPHTDQVIFSGSSTTWLVILPDAILRGTFSEQIGWKFTPGNFPNPQNSTYKNPELAEVDISSRFGSVNGIVGSARVFAESFESEFLYQEVRDLKLSILKMI